MCLIASVVFYEGNFLKLVFNGSGLQQPKMKQHAVAEQVLMAVQDAEHGIKQLVAFFIRNRGYDQQMLLTCLEKMLPPYMLPSVLIEVDQMPPVPGKVNEQTCLAEIKATVKDECPLTSLVVIQQYLLNIWRDVLQTDEVNIRDNFFEAGGDQLLAGLLVFRVNRCLGISMPLQWISEMPTIEGLAERIFRAHTHAGVLDPQTNNQEWQTGVKIAYLKPVASAPSFFFCPPLEGLQPATSITGIINMGPLLRKDVGFYCVHPPALQPALLHRLRNGHAIHLTDVLWSSTAFENMVEEAIENILAIQENGPYILGGFCTGCIMAAAISKRLMEKGKEVRTMILIDAPLGLAQPGKTAVSMEYTRNDIIWFVSHDIGKDLPGMDWTSVCERVEDVPDELIWQTMLALVHEKKALPDSVTAAELKAGFEHKFFNYPLVTHCLNITGYGYPASKITASLVLYTSSMYKELPPAFDVYVKEHILHGEVQVKEIPAGHLGLFQPNILPGWIDMINEQLVQ